ncbi:MAG: saccharopine dehydrogenase C-terminal domain-containing protein [Pseudomonadota bacterium]
MSEKFNKIAVLGLGKVGALAGELLHAAEFDVTGFDIHDSAELPFETRSIDVSDGDQINAGLQAFDGVFSALPYHLNLEVAKAAHNTGIHYFDLTEDVATTKAIIELSKTSNGLMVPQCGLAPGFVGIVGADLIARFEDCRSCKMRVGALPQNPTGLMGYSFNWSPEGVVNEYLNDCEVIEDGELKTVSPMEWKEKIYIDGVELEAFTTSGGLGTMCETYLGTVPNIDYKTLRYPGHMDQMNFFFHELLMRNRRREAGEILVTAKPPVKQDIVYIHVSAEGEIDGQLFREEFVRSFRPIEIGGKHRTAIAWTTSSSAVAVVELVRAGVLPQKGYLKQEDINLDMLAQTTAGGYLLAN